MSAGQGRGIAWVTGASRGIGRAIARSLAARGFQVVASARTAEACAALLDEARTQGWQMHAVTCDVRSEASVAAAHAWITEHVGVVSVLVNNAGVTRFTSFDRSELSDFDELIAVNLRGPFLCTKQVLPAMKERRSGAIVMINSMAAREVFRDSAMYSATKAGLKLMTDCLRLEVRSAGIRVLGVYPGATHTEIWPERVREKRGAAMMPPDRIGETVASLLVVPEDTMIEDVFMQPIGGPL